MFVMWAGGGNVNPFLGLAEHLQADGHSIVAVATGSLHARLGDAGITVLDPPDGWLPSADDVVDAIATARPDVIIVDYMLTGALCGAETSGIPTVALVHTLYTALLEDGAPNPIGMGGSVSDLNEVRTALGLGPIDSYGDLLDACAHVMVTAPEGFDQPAETSDNVRYVGALFEGPGPDAGWQPPTGDEPLVVVSIGTAGDPALELPLLATILEALESLPVRALVTVGDYIDRSQLAAPPNVTISDYVRHAAVFPHAALLVTHGGLGSVTAALAHAVPMICLPLDREQPDNARAVERVGAGIALEPSCTPDELRAAIKRALRLTRVRFEPTPRKAVELLTS